MTTVNVSLADTFDEWRIKTNSIGAQTGDLANLVTVDKTSIVAAINEIFNNDSDDMENLIDDTTPQLGGPLDLNSNNIEGTGSINITGAANFTGAVSTNILMSTNNTDITIIPDGTGKTNITGLKLTDNMDLNSQNLTGTGDINITGNITATTITGSTSIDSTVTAVTQTPNDNSTKVATTAYVDAQVATENTLLEMDDVNITTPADGDMLTYDLTNNEWTNTVLTTGATEGFAVSMAIALG